MKRILNVLIKVFILVMIVFFVVKINEYSQKEESVNVVLDGSYSSVDEVAAYISLFGNLPNNYITKNEAAKLGYSASKKNLWEVSDQKSIGGDIFFNREGILPSKKGRIYYEADIDFDGKNRGAKRIVFSNDGLIYYTDDHYDSFIEIEVEK